MLRMDLRRAASGMKLALPVHNPSAPSRVLLRVGYTLTEETIAKLIDTGVRSVWVRYPSLSFLEDILDVETQQKQAALVSTISDTFETLQGESAAKLPYDQYTNTIGDMIDHIVGNPRSAVFLGDLSESDDGMMRRAAAVSYLSILIGLKLEMYIVKQRPHVPPDRAKDVLNLGLGAMLHDVGVTQLPEEVRTRYRERGDESDPAWREHPLLGFRMVRGHIDPSAATVVLNHHQRFNGTGYCGKGMPQLSGTNIHIFARITAVADAFDRLRHPPGHPEQPTVWVLSAILTTDVAKLFDPYVLQALMEVVPPYAPGTVLRLSDDRWAVAIDHNSHDPCRPVVQIISDPEELAPDADDLPPGQRLDLSTAPSDLAVAWADGRDVSAHNFPAPQLAANVLSASW